MPDAEQGRVEEKARESAREGKSPSTQAGEFLREEMHHVREGKHEARSAQRAIVYRTSEGAPDRGVVTLMELLPE